MNISLYNTLTKKVELFTPVQPGHAKVYSCGPTVYNHAHIGNMRAFLFADLLQRVLRVVGQYNVHWVMNITDIDDKTIRDSKVGSDKWLAEMGEQSGNPNADLSTFTKYYESKFVEDITKLGIEATHFISMPRATEFIPAMQELIRNIVRNGFGYVAEGSVYFNLNAWRDADSYGKLFQVDFGNFREGVRIDADEYERESVSDFVLWKATKDGEPYWDFEFDGEHLPGRPGWHIECSAMGKELLGLPFDIHTGGVDLRFPHHEDEIAQSKAGYGVEPASFWCHNEFLEVEGKKMSKSLGNFFTLHDLLEKGIDALDIRFAMLSAHYQSVFNFTFDGITAAHKARTRVQDFIYDVWSANGTEHIDVQSVRTSVFGELANDVHTPKALAQLFGFINKTNPTTINEQSKQELLAFFTELNNVFNVWQISSRPEVIIEIPEDVIALAQQRWQAKKDKNFALSDSLRQQITERGYVVKDTKEGFEVVKE